MKRISNMIVKIIWKTNLMKNDRSTAMIWSISRQNPDHISMYRLPICEHELHLLGRGDTIDLASRVDEDRLLTFL